MLRRFVNFHKISNIDRVFSQYSIISRSTKDKYDRGPSLYILPDLINENIEDNVWLNFSKPPNICEIDGAKAFIGISRLIIQYQLRIEKLVDAQKDKEFDLKSSVDFIEKIAMLSTQLDHKYLLLTGSQSFVNDLMMKIVCGRLHNKISTCKLENLFQNPKILTILCKLYENIEDLSRYQKLLVLDLLNLSFLSGSSYGIITEDISKMPLYNTLSKDIKKNYFPEYFLNSSFKRDKQYFADYTQKLSHFETEFNRLVLVSAVSNSLGLSYSRFHDGVMKKSPTSNDLIGSLKFYPVSESDLASSCPNWLPQTLGGYLNGGHIIGMNLDLSDDGPSNLLMRHSMNRELRRYIWENLNTRATMESFGSSSQHASNSQIIESIRKCRRSLVELLPKQNKPVDYLHAVWDATGSITRLPSSPQWLVDSVLEPLREGLLEQVQIEWNLLKDWAKSQLNIVGKLEYWDLEYAIEQFNYYHSIDSGETLRHNKNTAFIHSLDTILPVLLCFYENFFNDISFEIVDSGRVNELISPDVSSFCKVVKVYDRQTNDVLGEILIDLFERANKPRCLGFSNFTPLTTKLKEHNYPAITVISAKISHEDSGVREIPQELFRALLLTHENTVSLCASMGSCLQHITSLRPYHSLFGIFPTSAALTSSIPLLPSGSALSDLRMILADVASLIFSQNSGLARLSTSQNLSSNKGPIDAKPFFPTSVTPLDGNKKKVRCIVALPLMRLLLESRFDLALWSKDYYSTPWRSILRELHDEHLPYKVDQHSPAMNWPCSAQRIFGRQSSPTTLYFQVLRFVLAQDVYASFCETNNGTFTNIDDSNIKSKLHEFSDLLVRDTEGLSPSVAFKKFRGREPDISFLIAALLKVSGSDLSSNIMRSSDKLLDTISKNQLTSNT